MLKAKKILILLLVFVVLYNIINVAYATTGLATDVSMPSGGSGGSVNTITSAETAVSKIWGSAKLILQVAALATILGCGIRYMFASADQKADIKKSLGILILGAAIVFGTTIVVDFIQDIAGQLLDI